MHFFNPLNCVQSQSNFITLIWLLNLLWNLAFCVVLSRLSDSHLIIPYQFLLMNFSSCLSDHNSAVLAISRPTCVLNHKLVVIMHICHETVHLMRGKRSQLCLYIRKSLWLRRPSKIDEETACCLGSSAYCRSIHSLQMDSQQRVKISDTCSDWVSPMVSPMVPWSFRWSVRLG